MLTIKTAGFEEYLDPSGGAWIKALILGEYGVGKTPSAARWPDPIIADCEHGVMSVARLGTPFATITSSKDMEELIDYLRRDSMLPPEKRKHRTAIIDTIDSYQRTLTSERLKAEHKESLSGWADWGWLGGKMSQLIEKLLNLPINVVVNMHVKDATDDDGDSSILVKKSALKGEIGDSIYRDFDLIGLMEKNYELEDGERVLHRHIRWHSEPRFPMLRDRSGNLPRFTDIDFTEDDFFRIFNAITAGVDDLPESGTLETIGEEEAAPAAPDAPGGPVGNVKLPKSPPVKKAAAKKTAAKAVKGQHVTKADVGDEPVVTEEAGTPVDAETPQSTDVHDEAEALLADKLGATVIEGSDEKAEVVETDKPAPPIKGDEPEVTSPPACGDVPPGLDGDPSLGCRVELTPQNALKRSMAQLRTKTLLCDSCFEAWKSNN